MWFFLDKEDGEKLGKQVNEACLLLDDYNGRLAQELEERKKVAKMLSDFIFYQKELLARQEQKLEVSVILRMITCLNQGCIS